MPLQAQAAPGKASAISTTLREPAPRAKPRPAEPERERAATTEMASGSEAESETETETETVTPGAASKSAADDDASSPGRTALAAGASLVPGALVHGAGSYVLGDGDTAGRLLLLEGAGVGLIFGGLGGLALTGAGRYVSGPLAATTIAGVSLFSLTLLADIYRVAAPAEGFGVPRQTRFFESHFGYVQVNDPVFEHRHFVHQGFRFQPNLIGMRFEAFHAPGQGNARVRLHPSVRIWQPRACAAPPCKATNGRDGSFLDASFAGTLHQFERDGFSTMTYDFMLEQRLDATRIVPNLRGAFTEFNLGYAVRNTEFSDFAVSSYDTLLLAGFGFGMYLGSATGPGGEALLYYDHRHDDFAAGFKATGLGSGVAGHIGAKAHYYFDKHWGVGALTEVGSAWVFGLGLRVRVNRSKAVVPAPWPALFE